MAARAARSVMLIAICQKEADYYVDVNSLPGQKGGSPPVMDKFY